MSSEPLRTFLWTSVGSCSLTKQHSDGRLVDDLCRGRSSRCFWRLALAGAGSFDPKLDTDGLSSSWSKGKTWRKIYDEERWKVKILYKETQVFNAKLRILRILSTRSGCMRAWRSGLAVEVCHLGHLIWQLDSDLTGLTDWLECTDRWHSGTN